MKSVIKKLWSDENGLTTMEIIIGSVLLGGAATLVGFALTAGFRGKTGAFVNSLDNIQSMNEPITEKAKFGYIDDSSSGESNTGIVTKVKEAATQ